MHNQQEERVQAGEIKSVGSVTRRVANKSVKVSYKQALAMRRGLKDFDMSEFTKGVKEDDLAEATAMGTSIMAYSDLSITELRQQDPEAFKMTLSEYNEYLKSQGISNSYDRRKKIGQVFFGSE